MICKVIPASRATDTLTRLNCCAALLVEVIEDMQAAGAPQRSLLSLVGTCDLLEAIIGDFCQTVETADCVQFGHIGRSERQC